MTLRVVYGPSGQCRQHPRLLLVCCLLMSVQHGRPGGSQDHGHHHRGHEGGRLPSQPGHLRQGLRVRQHRPSPHSTSCSPHAARHMLHPLLATSHPKGNVPSSWTMDLQLHTATARRRVCIASALHVGCPTLLKVLRRMVKIRIVLVCAVSHQVRGAGGHPLPPHHSQGGHLHLRQAQAGGYHTEETRGEWCDTRQGTQ